MVLNKTLQVFMCSLFSQRHVDLVNTGVFYIPIRNVSMLYQGLSIVSTIYFKSFTDQFQMINSEDFIQVRHSPKHVLTILFLSFKGVFKRYENSVLIPLYN